MKYELLGLKPASDAEGGQSFHQTSRNFLAILRPAFGGRRLVAEVTRADCKDWPTCRTAIVRYLNKGAGKRKIEEEDIETPSERGSWPWVTEPPLPETVGTVQSGFPQSSLLTTPGIDRTAGRSFNRQAQFSHKTNQDYLKELEEVNFIAPTTSEQRLAAIDAEIARNEEEIARNNAQIEAIRNERSSSIRNNGLELMQTLAGTPDAPGTLADHVELMRSTEIGKAALQYNARHRRF